MDMAKLGQLLLNKGAYGKQRFFKETTFELMLPVTQTRTLGQGTRRVVGVGLMFSGEPYSQKTIGHGAASSATFRVDPVNDLLVVTCRNNAGNNYEKYNPQFENLVIDCLANPAPPASRVPNGNAPN